MFNPISVIYDGIEDDSGSGGEHLTVNFLCNLA